MENLFKISDFDQFTKYAGRSQAEAPDGYDKLRPIYDKLGKIADGLKSIGYNKEINRMVYTQRQTYCEYHWARIYPKEQQHYNECLGKVFFVIGTDEGGLNIHIDSYESKGFRCNKAAKDIKEQTWYNYTKEEASNLTLDKIVMMFDEYIKNNRKEFNLFAKEFGINRSIEILNKMDINSIKDLLLGNYNIILTGAPGTGKTYLAKEVAKSMGAEWKLVQFHPSYDYTDFVEGLRPIIKDKNIGFQRKDGVFKSFCKKSIEANGGYKSTKDAIQAFKNDLVKAGSNGIKVKSHKGWSEFNVSFGDSNFKITVDSGNTWDCGIEAVEKYIETGEYNQGHQTYQPSIGEYIKMKYMQESKPFVFIIDEINRGEISKIFGELFYSIDPGYRGKDGKVETQYQNLISKEGDDDFDTANADVFRDGFYIPENVYIIGTMNDIDRSVESMDFAMRRRFAWKEISVESRQSMLDDEKAWGENKKPEDDIINQIKIRMKNLNACIIDEYGDTEQLPSKDKLGLTKAYQIGASYFLKYSLYNNFEKLWMNHIEGLLYEYLRGTANIESKIERLNNAYNDTTEH